MGLKAQQAAERLQKRMIERESGVDEEELDRMHELATQALTGEGTNTRPDVRSWFRDNAGILLDTLLKLSLISASLKFLFEKLI